MRMGRRRKRERRIQMHQRGQCQALCTSHKLKGRYVCMSSWVLLKYSLSLNFINIPSIIILKYSFIRAESNYHPNHNTLSCLEASMRLRLGYNPSSIYLGLSTCEYSQHGREQWLKGINNDDLYLQTLKSMMKPVICPPFFCHKHNISLASSEWLSYSAKILVNIYFVSILVVSHLTFKVLMDDMICMPFSLN